MGPEMYWTKGKKAPSVTDLVFCQLFDHESRKNLHNRNGFIVHIINPTIIVDLALFEAP